MTPARTPVFAVAAGLAAGNLYWAQPLIKTIAAALDVSSSIAATVVTVTQAGYALGIFFLLVLPGPARSRLNTAFFVGNFLGGAAGSAVTAPSGRPAAGP